MKKIYINFVLLLFITGVHGATFTSVKTGNFAVAATWDQNKIPTIDDDIIILAEHTVSVAGATNITIANLTINGVVNFINNATGQLTVGGDLLVNSGGKLEAYGTTTGKYVNLAGNLTNNGTVDFKYASSSLKGLVLNGTTLQTISGAGVFSPFSYVSVDNAAGIVLNSPINITRTLTLVNGELENNSTITMDNKLSPVTANFATISRSSSSSISGTPIEVGSTTGAALYLSYLGTTAIIESGEVPSSRSFHQLTISNAAGLQFNDDLELKGATPLILTNGVITISDGKTISCSSLPATGSATSYINGAVAVKVSSSNTNPVNFPVGSDGFYRKITINGLKSSDSNPSTVRVAIVNPNGGTLGAGLTSLSTKRRWEMLLTTGSGITYSSASVDYGNDDGSSIDVLSQSALLNGTYEALPAGSHTAINVTTANGTYTNTGYFALGTAGVLPVELAWFKARAEERRVNLSWQTLSEKVNDKFVIERSFDGITFLPLTSVNGNQTTESVNNYTVYDNNPANGFNYYQLLQYDQNGIKTILGLQFIDYSLSGELRVMIYPNPVTEKLNIHFGKYKSDNTFITVTNFSGRQIFKKIVSADEIKNGYTLMMDKGFEKGLYLLIVESENRSEKFKIIKN